MEEHKLGVMEMRFAQIMWQNEPVSSGELVKICERELNWKKSTTYTMLRRLCQRGIFQNENGIVSSLISREELRALQGEAFLEENFDGSLPKFIAAFAKHKKLSSKEVEEIQKLIADHRG